MISIRSIRITGAFLAAFWLLTATTPALAIDTICVQTAADLFTALNTAQSVPKRIEVSQGAYNLDSNTSFEAQYSFAPGTSIEGGYFDGCGFRTIAVGNTIFKATEDVYFHPVGNLSIEGLTFEMQFGLRVSPDIYAVPGLQVLFRRDVFRNSGSSYSGVLDLSWYMLDSDLGGGAKVEDSLFVNNAPMDGFCTIDMSSENGTATFTLVNNTVVNNGAGVCMRNYPDSSNPGNGSLFAYNNIIYGNPGDDIYTDTANLELKWNTFATFIGPTPTTEAFTQHGDPKLDANYHPITSPVSPVINTGAFDGNPDLTLHDLDGGPRVVGTRVDRGAYESNVDDSYLLKVKNTDNAGVDSLRAAITSANANGGGLISFEIPGDCTPAHVITLTSGLPPITAPVIINGYSQAGAAANTLDIGDDAEICVVLDGAANLIGNGLLVAPAAPANTQLTVLGIGFSGFVDAAINLSGGTGHGVQGNHVGGKVNGVTLAQSGYGVYVAEGVNDVAIGGDYPANRNIIGDAKFDGIHIHGPANSKPAASGTTVTNNYVGMGWNSATSAFINHGNALKGIHVLGSNNQITRNIIGFNSSDGVDFDGTFATGNSIENNFIGIAFTDSAGYSTTNGAAGVRVENGGHDNKILSNSIADNATGGVRVVSGLGNTIRFNDIFSNDAAGGLGIDLAGAGLTPNDNDGSVVAMQMANRGLNFPLLTLATGAPSSPSLVKGLLTTTPGDYYIDIYATPNCNASGQGEGQTWFGSTKITISQSATFANFSLSVGTFGIPVGWAVSATATDAARNASPGNTSEFSACKTMTNDRIFLSEFDPPPV